VRLLAEVFPEKPVRGAAIHWVDYGVLEMVEMMKEE